MLTQYLCFLARLAVEDSVYLSNAVNSVGQQFGQPSLLPMLIDLWMEKVRRDEAISRLVWIRARIP